MATASLNLLVRRLRQSTETASSDGQADEELLSRFVAGDTSAFELLVWRYGPAVLAACRKVLTTEADIEDAFQATFLTLLHGARSIRSGGAVGGWLCGVAHRVAVRVLDTSRRRRRRECRVARAEEGPGSADLSWREACEALHEELDRLPPMYRLPLVLCYLQGASRDEAARQLGWSLQSLKGRLERAREKLRQRLVRRGITLSAGLLAALGDSATARSVPPRLVQATLQAAAGRVPAGVAVLLQGVTPAMKKGPITLLLALLIVALTATAGAGLGERRSSPPPSEDRRDKLGGSPAQEQRFARADEPKDASVVVGRVLGPDGKARKDASVCLWANTGNEPLTRTTTDAEGRFRLSTPKGAVARGGKIVATAEGHGPAWTDATTGAGELTLRLVRDDVPVNGRILSLEGKPVVGATVKVLALDEPTDGGLDAWIDGQKRNRPYEVKRLRPAALGVATTFRTGKDGRFRVTGLGRERVVFLQISGANLSSAQFWALTRTKAPEGLRSGYYGTYAGTFDFHVKPSKPIVGTVRDRRTGKPLAGITIGSHRWVNLSTKTDANGHYRIDGIPKDSEYTVSAGGRGYFNSTKLQVPDTAGLDPITADFELDPGIVVQGRVLDSEGKPVRGYVGYLATPDNPHRKDFPDFGQPQALVTREGDTGEDGSFTVLAIPGQGALVVAANDADRYARSEPGKVNVGNYILEGYHAVVPISVPEKKPTVVAPKIVLERGRALAGTVAGPDGKPLAGTCVAGLSSVCSFGFGRAPTPRPRASFTVGGLSPKETRTVVFIHPEKKLARVLKVRGDEKDPLTVRLEPLGELTGRVLAADGKPWAGLPVRVMISFQEKDYRELPADLRFDYPSWEKLISAETTTDKDGRFRVGGLVPGLKYTVSATEGDPSAGVFAYSGAVPSVQSGKVRDLGDLKSKRTPDK
jgi:RNA polymerase sigma factor (sigma-70 family)